MPLAEEVKRLAGVAVSAVGLITEAEQAEEIVASGRADAVMIARASPRNPHFPLAAAEDLGADAPWPPQYVRAARRRSRAAGQR